MQVFFCDPAQYACGHRHIACFRAGGHRHIAYIHLSLSIIRSLCRRTLPLPRPWHLRPGQARARGPGQWHGRCYGQAAAEATRRRPSRARARTRRSASGAGPAARRRAGQQLLWTLQGGPGQHSSQWAASIGWRPGFSLCSASAQSWGLRCIQHTSNWHVLGWPLR